MNKEKIKKNYFKYLNVKKNYKFKDIKCEICSSKNSKILQKKISWNNNKFGILPVCCCLNCGFVFQNPRFEEKFYKDYVEDQREINFQLRKIVEKFSDENVLFALRSDYQCIKNERRCFMYFPDLQAKVLFDYGHITSDGAKVLGRLISEAEWLRDFVN